MQHTLLELFSDHSGRSNNPFSNREMTRLIFGPDFTPDHFARQFVHTIRGQRRYEPTPYALHSLIFHIDQCTRIPIILKILAISEIKKYGLRNNIIHDRSINHEYNLYRILADIFTKNRPDLLSRSSRYFMMEALSVLIMGTRNKYDKNVIREGIETENSYYSPDLGKMYAKISALINNPNLKQFGQIAIKSYNSIKSQQEYLNLNIAQPYRGKRNLYGFGWHNSKLSSARNLKLKRETFNLDGMTGNIVIKGVAHHIEFDKSQTNDKYLIWVDESTNFGGMIEGERIIRDPPRQKYFGQPIQFTPESIEDMNTLRQAKIAFSQERHPIHWGDKNHKCYNPDAIRRFYWYKQNVKRYGYKWLDLQQERYKNNPRRDEHIPDNYGTYSR